jgi:hypothetical protein
MIPLRFVAVVAVIAAAAFLGRDSLRVAAAETACGAARTWRAAGPVHLLALAVITAAGVVVRLHFLDGPMRWDESYSFIAYALPPWKYGLAIYDAGNNHVFHTMLVHLSYKLFGDGPRAVRAPAFAAGVLLPPAIYVAALRLYGRQAALIAAALAAGSAQLIEYSTNARGYTLVALFATVMVAVGAHLTRAGADNLAYWALFSIAGALALYTQPVSIAVIAVVVAAMALSALCGAIVSSRRRFLFSLAGSLVASLALSALLYGPIADDVVRLLTHQTPYSTDAVATYRLIWGYWKLGIPTAGVVLVVAGFAISLVRVPRSPTSPLPLAATFVALLIVAAVTHHVPVFQRWWLPLLPLALIATVGGLLGWGRVRAFLDHDRFDLAVSIAAVAIAVSLAHVIERDRLANQDGSMLPAAPQIAELVGPRLKGYDKLLVSSEAAPIAGYELLHHGFASGWVADHLEPEQAREGRTYVVVNELAGETLRSAVASMAPGSGLRPRGIELGRFPHAEVFELAPPRKLG